MGENASHHIHITGRKDFSMQGVLKVENFDTEKISLETTLGDLLICGEDLHIEHLYLEEQRLVVRGQINSIAYVEATGKRGRQKRNQNLVQRLMR
ncbi:MAG: sporulation protein YabP [Clostridia bacterium]|jgi:sporulation protein YabP|nr:sporulation protein YabP [Clostridia bacterium]MDD4572149.1 sporulation protein YabP [Clostridia bacterium]